MSITLTKAGFIGTKAKARDVIHKKDLGTVTNSISLTVPTKGV